MTVDGMMASSFSANSTQNGGTPDECQKSRKSQGASTDPAIALFASWRRAQRVALVLCRLQQRLERRVLDAQCPETGDTKISYSIDYQAEAEAVTAVLKLQDTLPFTSAWSLLGVVAKLEMIAGADREIDDPTDFPWPHITSVLADLKKIAGNAPLERPHRSVVHTDCRRYQAMASDLVGREKPGANPRR